MVLGKRALWPGLLCCCLIIALAGVVFAGDYITDSKAKVKVWNASPTITAEWAGGKKDGYADGKGVMKWFENGVLNEKFEGTYVKGKAEGKCTYEVYDSKGKVILSGEAEFKGGAPNGKGVMKWSDGRKYEGALKDGKEHGKGVFTWKDGTRYEGDFVFGVITGKGVITSKDGKKYEGEFKHGLPNGKGTKTLPGGKKETGTFENGKLTGK
ncbi:MAG: hypothetical protein RDV48_21515 [Candidatus Eremiobacteraeota bacterium]|nr:hypothetical protein [Candidatus Eremiobacteraeota bacterium]